MPDDRSSVRERIDVKVIVRVLVCARVVVNMRTCLRLTVPVCWLGMGMHMLVLTVEMDMATATADRTHQTTSTSLMRSSFHDTISTPPAHRGQSGKNPSRNPSHSHERHRPEIGTSSISISAP